MRVLISIVIWSTIFMSWVWVMDLVNREFWYTARSYLFMSLTFYTGGVVGVILLLGRRKRSPFLARWLNFIMNDTPSKTRDGAGKGAGSKSRRPEGLEGEALSDGGAEESEGEEEKCDILEFVLKKAVERRASEIHFEQVAGELRINYVADENIDMDKVLAMRDRVISALRMKINRAAAQRAGTDPAILVKVGERAVRFRAVSPGEGGGGKIVLVRIQ